MDYINMLNEMPIVYIRDLHQFWAGYDQSDGYELYSHLGEIFVFRNRKDAEENRRVLIEMAMA